MPYEKENLIPTRRGAGHSDLVGADGRCGNRTKSFPINDSLGRDKFFSQRELIFSQNRYIIGRKKRTMGERREPMRNFDYHKLAERTWDNEILSYLAQIHEHKSNNWMMHLQGI